MGKINSLTSVICQEDAVRLTEGKKDKEGREILPTKATWQEPVSTKVDNKEVTGIFEWVEYTTVKDAISDGITETEIMTDFNTIRRRREYNSAISNLREPERNLKQATNKLNKLSEAEKLTILAESLGVSVEALKKLK